MVWDCHRSRPGPTSQQAEKWGLKIDKNVKVLSHQLSVLKERRAWSYGISGEEISLEWGVMMVLKSQVAFGKSLESCLDTPGIKVQTPWGTLDNAGYEQSHHNEEVMSQA